MRYRLDSLQPAIAQALELRLAAAGHEAAAGADDADLLAIALGLPLDGTPLLDVRQDAWHATIARIRAVFTDVRDHTARLVEREAPGRVAIVVDPPVLRAMERTGLIAAAGAFLTTIAEVGAAELGPRGIAVNTLVAGWTAPAPAALGAGAPLGRLAEPDEIARACAFLLDPEQGAFVTGATLAADGGWWVTRAEGGNPLLA